jgi:hypothetical protein
MTCRRRINSARLRQDLSEARRVVTHATTDSTEHVEPFTQGNQRDIPEDEADEETTSDITTTP